MNKQKILSTAMLLGAALIGNAAQAACLAPLPTHAQLVTKLKAAQSQANGGLGNHMWATVVTRGGVVCDVAFSGTNAGSQWLGSRVISAQKANTANAFSLDGFALSTANLYSATQPGGSLFGLQESNPVDATFAYAGAFSTFGSALDPMIGKRIGGVNVFGGGLALYDANDKLVGGIGVSGDSSCADHNIAWRLRAGLGLDQSATVGGVAGTTPKDGIIYGTGGWKHPDCGNGESTVSTTIGSGQ